MTFSIKGCYTAGGAVLSEVTKTPINDYDIYPKNNEGLLNAISYLLEDEGGFVVGHTDKALTIKTNQVDLKTNLRTIYQIILTDFYPTAESIFEHFDFTVCMAAYDGDTEQLEVHPKFWQDVASRTLRFHMGTLFPLNSLLRIKKYTDRGYFLPKSEHIKMILAAAKKGIPNSWEEFEAQIGGIYGKTVVLDENAKQTAFSIEAAVEILDKVSEFAYLNGEFTYQDQAETFSKFKNDSWLYALDKELKIEYFEAPDKNPMWSKVGTVKPILVRKNGEDHLNIITVPFIPKHWTKIDPKQQFRTLISATTGKDEKVSIRAQNWSTIIVNEGDVVHNFGAYLGGADVYNHFSVILMSTFEEISYIDVGYVQLKQCQVAGTITTDQLKENQFQNILE